MDTLTTHLRIVSAFIIREVASRYGKSPGGYIWAVLEPVAFVGMISVLMTYIGRVPAMGESFPLFYATGYIGFNMYRTMESYIGAAIGANKHLLRYPKVAPIDPVIARIILQAVTSVVVACVVISGTFFTVHSQITIEWRPVIEATIYAWGMAIGVALINSVLFFHYPLYQKAFAIITRPLFILSGVFYVPAMLPHPFRDVLLSNPLTHMVIMFREGFYGVRQWDGLDVWFLRETSMALFFAGLVVFTFWPISRLQE